LISQEKEGSEFGELNVDQVVKNLKKYLKQLYTSKKKNQISLRFFEIFAEKQPKIMWRMVDRIVEGLTIGKGTPRKLYVYTIIAELLKKKNEMGSEEISSFESVAEKLLIGFEQFFAIEQKKVRRDSIIKKFIYIIRGYKFFSNEKLNQLLPLDRMKKVFEDLLKNFPDSQVIKNNYTNLQKFYKK